MSHTLGIQTLKSMKSPCCSSTIPYFLSHFSVHHRASRKMYLFKNVSVLEFPSLIWELFNFTFQFWLSWAVLKRRFVTSLQTWSHRGSDIADGAVQEDVIFSLCFRLVFLLYHHCSCHTATCIGFDMNSLWPGDSTGAETGSEFRTLVWNGEKKSPLTAKTVF